MTFMPMGNTGNRRIVPGRGPKSADIVIIGDYTSPFDDHDLKPFSGPGGNVLEGCLHAAGLILGEVYLTNTFKSRTRLSGKAANKDFFDEKKKSFTELGLAHAEMLRDELNDLPANIIVPAGLPALMAISSMNSVNKYRGYVCAADKLKGTRKIIPTYSPAQTIYGTYVNRHVIVNDLKKAKVECTKPEIVRPERTLVYIYDNLQEAMDWLKYFEEQEYLCFDIEVINYEVSCISFSSDPGIGCVIAFGATEFSSKGWTELEELELWRGVQRVLGNPKSTKTVQNGMFDIHFLLTRNGVVVRGPINDTMIGHSVMFPELPKGLDFLGSLYCGAQEYWKDAVKFDNIKGES